MSSRSIQIVALEQKIERLKAQLEYLQKLDELEAKQSSQIENNSTDQKKAEDSK
jgi:uncharacterized coiled-coil protein SlyX